MLCVKTLTYEVAQQDIVLSSEIIVLVGQEMADPDVYELVLRQFGV